MKKTYKDVDLSSLKSIPNPDKKTYEIKIKQPELTFLGVYEQPDFASQYILFYPCKKVIELKLNSWAYETLNFGGYWNWDP